MREGLRYFEVWLLVLPIILFQSCAQVGSPTGGAKDSTPPGVVQYTPENFSTNFIGDEIVIEFDEYIQFQDIYSELIISPPLNTRPDISIRKKSVILKIKEELKSDATYIFNFGNGVADYSEGNPAKDLLYIFSTGSELDSLSVAGNVIDAYTKKGVESVKVMLYEEDIDSLPYLEKPYYFSQTDEKGNFRINYVKDGSFKIIALADENSNYKFDTGEGIAFLDSMITSAIADSSSVSYDMFLSTEKDTMQFISDYSRDSTGFVRMAMNNAPESLAFDLINSKSRFYYEQDTSNDSIYFWLIDMPSNSDIDLIVKDAGATLDTLPIRHYKLDRYEALKVESKSHTKIRAEEAIHLSNPDYITTVDEEFVQFVSDSIPIETQISIDTISKRHLNISAQLNSGKSYQLTLYPGAVTNLHGATNDTLEFSYETYSEEYYGEIYLSLIGFEKVDSGILQLLDKNDKVIEELSDFQLDKINFTKLLPGDYYLKMINDSNQNGEWDTGNYLQKTHPEEIIHFPNPITVRSNWTLEYEWDLEFE